MNKVFINKETNMVEQILGIRQGEIIPDNYFSNCYAVEDKKGKVNAYNLRYNKETGEFKEVEGVPAKDEVKVIEKNENEEIERIKSENKELRAEIEEIKKILAGKGVL